MNWTTNDKKTIIELKNKGLTYAEIAAKMGRSRGSIAAFISDNKELFPIVNGLFKYDKITLKQKPTPENTKIDTPPRITPKINSLNVPFLETKHNQCRWICDDGFWDEPHKESICCGLEIHKRSYCKFHYKESIKTND